MKTFTDTEQREWTLRLTIGAAERIKDELAVDLLEIDAGDPPLLTRLATDLRLLASVIAKMLEPQFDQHGVDAADVREAFDAPTLAAAREAFFAELADFTRALGRADRATMIERQEELVAEGVRQNVERIRKIQIPETKTTTRGRRSGRSRASSASTPDR